MRKYLICSLLFFFASIKIQAQGIQTTATGHIQAEVITAFSAVETSQMNFGRFSPGPYGGEIILTPQGTSSVLGSVAKGSGIHNAASFLLSGENNIAFSINLPDKSATITNTTDSKTMTVKNWVSVPSPGIAAGTLQNGIQTVFVGATLEVGTMNDNPVGIYTGTYVITFDFN
jgi:hypothetical protein